MKNSGTFEEQTEEIVEALLSAFIHKKTETTFRGLRLQGSIQVCQTGKIACVAGSQLTTELSCLKAHGVRNFCLILVVSNEN